MDTAEGDAPAKPSTLVIERRILDIVCVISLE
jgi:hypothetical protein